MPTTARLTASRRVLRFLERPGLPTPVLVIDVAFAADRYLQLQRALPGALIHYATKANPSPELICALARAGSAFDVASSAEIENCLSLGIAPGRLSFGHTVKKSSAIAAAHAAGIDRFSCDSREELEKLGRHAPGARISVRLLTDGAGAEWPLSRKFGCDVALAADLFVHARALGLTPDGVAFHVGSQQTDPRAWEAPIAMAAEIFNALRQQGISLRCLNIGGGFPAQYVAPIPTIGAYGAAIEQSLRRHFGRRRPQLIVEPGRFLVADAGILQTEVVLVVRKSHDQDVRWVFVDCGKFGGLAETADEAIKYRLRVPGRTGPLTRVVLAGPTCDSADILYERTVCRLPADLEEGDRIQILSAGAYTHTYASVGFNGFTPLPAVFV